MTPVEQAKVFVDQARDRFANHPERRVLFAVNRTQAALKIPREEAEALVCEAESGPAPAEPVVVKSAFRDRFMKALGKR